VDGCAALQGVRGMCMPQPVRRSASNSTTRIGDDQEEEDH
jgi:hypothetical protein